MKIKHNDKSINIICWRKFKKLQRKCFVLPTTHPIFINENEFWPKGFRIRIFNINDSEIMITEIKNMLLEGKLYILCKNRKFLSRLKKQKYFYFSKHYHQMFYMNQNNKGYIIFKNKSEFLKWKLKQ